MSEYENVYLDETNWLKAKLDDALACNQMQADKVDNLTAELAELRKQLDWRPMDTDHPDHSGFVAVADFRDTAWGLSVTTGWYNEQTNTWVYPNNYRNMTHFKDCLGGNPNPYTLPKEGSITSEEKNDFLLRQTNQLKAELAELRERTRWRPLSEPVPDPEGLNKVVFRKKYGGPTGRRFICNTHWMPLPPPPEPE